MSVDRLTRVNELLKREIGEAVLRISEPGFDVSAVTVLGVEAAHNLRNARVRVSIRDHQQERDKYLRILHKHRVSFQSLINKNLKLKYTPRLNFVIDPSIEKGNRILGILYDLEQKMPPAENNTPEPNS
jgi:ribosome-binding factor A